MSENDVLLPPISRVPTGKVAWLTLVLVAANTMNGPGLLTLAAEFKNNGWVPSTLALICAAVTTGFTASLLTDVLEHAHLTGQSGEFSDLSLKGGSKLFWTTTWLLSVSLIMLSCAQIVVTAQAIDALLVSLFGGSFAVGFYPRITLLVSTTDSLMPFPSGTYGVSAGFILDAVLCSYLGSLDLVDNEVPQYLSSALTVYALGYIGLNAPASEDSQGAPAFGPGNGSELLGIAVFNFAYILAVPSLFADAREKRQFRGAMWCAILIALVVYVWVGAVGATISGSIHDNLLQAVYEGLPGVFPKSAVFAYAFALALPIPVYVILLRRNLVGLAPEHASIVATSAPWLLASCFYMQPWFSALVNWTSLLCLGFMNYTIPLLLVSQSTPSVPLSRRRGAFFLLLLTTLAIAAAITQNIGFHRAVRDTIRPSVELKV